jgi:hypothetical protein
MRNPADDLYQDENGSWRRRSIIVGSDPYATARDFTKRKMRVPDVLNAAYGFGPPGHDRPPVGFIPPEDRMVRIRRVNERGHEVTESVRMRDLNAALAAGAVRV